MRTLKSKPFSLFVFAALALAMSGCGKSNNNAAPVVPGMVNGQYNYGNGQYGGLSGVGGAFSGQLRVDSSNVMTSDPFGQYNCSLIGTVESLNMIGQSAYGQIVITGQRQNCYAQANAQVQLSAAVAQQIAYSMGMTGTIGSVQIYSINLGRRADNSMGGNYALYGGTVQVVINGSIPYTLYF